MSESGGQSGAQIRAKLISVSHRVFRMASPTSWETRRIVSQRMMSCGSNESGSLTKSAPIWSGSSWKS